MTAFLTLSALQRGWILLWNTLIILVIFYQLVMLIRKKVRPGHILGALFILGLNYIFLQYLMTLNIVADSAESSLSVRTVIALLIVFSLICIIQQMKTITGEQNHITPMSIKESVDQLPAGVCCYYSGGLCKLVNEKMNQVCCEITGSGLRDGELFWNTLTRGNIQNGTPIQTGEHPIILLPDGNVIGFRKDQLRFQDILLYEVIAVDVTEEYRLTVELRHKEEQLREINQRLKNLGDQITRLTTEKEILNSKIRLHDDWGRALLAAKAFLTDQKGVGRSDLFRIWDRNITLLENEKISPLPQIYSDVIDSAKVLGLTVTVTGTLPEQPEQSAVTAQAMTACLSNLARHAHGTELYVECFQEEEKVLLTFTNNGKAPEEDIRETGGLANLRRRVESTGGMMTVRSTPHFKLQLELREE